MKREVSLVYISKTTLLSLTMPGLMPADIKIAFTIGKNHTCMNEQKPG